MHKNGRFFISVISGEQFVRSVWDPYAYRQTGKSQVLAEFATIKRIGAKSVSNECLPFEPIEYRDIPGGSYLSFKLHSANPGQASKLPTIGEGELLFGTMRAYLGNIIVTPRANWINRAAPLYFQVKSEFILVRPHDGLHYFWLAYLRSRQFLSQLPIGHGGTRPRLQPEGLAGTPVTVPEQGIREDIDLELNKLAKEEWTNYFKSALLTSYLTEERLDFSLDDRSASRHNSEANSRVEKRT